MVVFYYWDTHLGVWKYLNTYNLNDSFIANLHDVFDDELSRIENCIESLLYYHRYLDGRIRAYLILYPTSDRYRG